MSKGIWSWIKSITQDPAPPVPSFQRKKPSKDSPIPAKKNEQHHYNQFSKTKPSNDTQFDIKEFLSTLESKLKQQDSTLEKDNCIQALAVARSISKFQNEENKVSMIKGLISFKEAMMTVRAVRWRDGLFCPKCHRKNIKVVSLENDKYEYKCVDCEKESGGDDSDTDNPIFLFDDLTGLDIEKDMASVIKWVLCFYLQAFLSTGKISKYLGVDPEYALYLIHMINVGSKINLDKNNAYKDKGKK